MRRALWAILFLGLFATATEAQTVTASGVGAQDGTGNLNTGGQWCFGATCLTVTAGSFSGSVTAGTQTVTIKNASSTTVLSLPNVVIPSGQPFNWNLYFVPANATVTATGNPYLPCYVGATWSSSGTYYCQSFNGQMAWGTTQTPVPSGLISGFGSPTFACVAPCSYVQINASPTSSAHWDLLASAGTTSSTWALQGGSFTIAPSGDATGVTDTATIQGLINTHALVYLAAGNWYISGLSWTAASDLVCSNLGTTNIFMTSTTANFFTVNYGGGQANNESLGMTIKSCNLFYKGGVTPTAGDVLNISGVDGTHYLSGFHFENNHAYAVWGGIRTGNYLINNWFENNLFINPISTGDGCIFYNTALPAGDNNFIANQCVSGTNFNAGITIAQGDTTNFVANKLNGVGVVFTRAGTTMRTVFTANSFEGLPPSGCAIDFGTAGSNAPSNISITGGEIAGQTYTFCAGSNHSTTSDVDYYLTPTTILSQSIGALPNYVSSSTYFGYAGSPTSVGLGKTAYFSGLLGANTLYVNSASSGSLSVGGTNAAASLSGTVGLFTASGGASVEIGDYNTSGGGLLNAGTGAFSLQTFTGGIGAETYVQKIRMDSTGTGFGTGGTPANMPVFINSVNTTGNTLVIKQQQPSSGASANYSQVLIDGTAGTSNTSAAGIGVRSKVTGTQQDWAFFAGTSTTNNNWRLYDVTNAKDVANFVPAATGSYQENFTPLAAVGTQNVSGCTLSAAVGGSWAGKFASGTSGTCTVTITPGITAPNGFTCWANDLTTPTDKLQQTGTISTTTCTISGTTASADVVTWGLVAF